MRRGPDPNARQSGARTLGARRLGPRPLRADAGSAFVESIVAAAIVAMALGTTYRVIADGAGRDRAAEARRDALLVAQSELADVGAEVPLAAGAAAGQSGELAWRVDITPYDENEDKNPAGKLWNVVVSVRPRDGGTTLVSLRSLRMGPGTRD